MNTEQQQALQLANLQILLQRNPRSLVATVTAMTTLPEIRLLIAAVNGIEYQCRALGLQAYSKGNYEDSTLVATGTAKEIHRHFEQKLREALYAEYEDVLCVYHDGHMLETGLLTVLRVQMKAKNLLRNELCAY